MMINFDGKNDYLNRVKRDRMNIPSLELDQSKLQFATKQQIINSMTLLEKSYWNYIDKFNRFDQCKFPMYKLPDFIQKVCKDVNRTDAYQYFKTYNHYKKSIPTAGIIMYYRDEQQELWFIVVRINRCKIFSMPKGKQDKGELIRDTAIREFHEETGIDLCEYITENTSYASIYKTLFYIVESDSKVSVDKFKTREISQVKWVKCTDVIKYAKHYSKQTVETAKYLLHKE